MGMFWKHSPNLVYGFSHPLVQLHPVFPQDDPLPGTGILLLWLLSSLVALHFHYCLGKPHHWTVDFDISALHHDLSLGLDLLEGVLKACLPASPCCFASALHLLRLHNLSAQPSQW